MKRLLTLIVVAMVFISVGCGGDSHESLTASSVATTKELVATFDSIKDEASAKAAKDKLKSLLEKMNKINEAQAKLGMPSEAEVKAIDEKYGKQMEELQMKMASNMLRIGFDPKIRAVLDDIDMKGAKK